MLYGPVVPCRIWRCAEDRGHGRHRPMLLSEWQKALEMVIIGPTEKNDEGAKTENPS
jgi:hypothetical protein